MGLYLTLTPKSENDNLTISRRCYECAVVKNILQNIYIKNIK